MTRPAGPPAVRRLRSRVADAARLLPVLCLVLLVLPAVLLPGAAPRASIGNLAWLFGAWAALLFLTYLVSRAHSRSGEGGE